MIVLGIDPGFSITGYGILKKDGTKAYLLDHGYLRLPQGKSLAVRIGLFHDFFTEKIEHWKVTDVALETPFMGKNAQNFLKLGYLRGMLYFLANKHGANLLEFAPREVKQSVTGFGGASKEQVARVIHQLFPNLKDTNKLDVTDALAVTLCGFWKQKAML